MNPKLRTWLLLLGIPVAYALLLRLVFDLSIFSNFVAVMSISFFLFVPFGIGYLTITLSGAERVQKFSYRFFVP